MSPEARRPAPDGIALVDKPAGWTSHDVVAKVRGLLGTRKVGHAGTLDPDATGLLVLGVGRATRLLRFLTGLDKTYTGEAVLGVATATLDSSGEVTGRWDMGGVALDAVRAAAAGLTGTIRQVPPMVSAKKVGGRRLHELARAGQVIEREAVEVTVSRFDADAPSRDEAGVFPLTVTCSSGTYVRSLVADLGSALGGGAHLRNLRRLAVGRFTVDEAIALASLTPDHVMPPLTAFRGSDPVLTTDALVAMVRNGRVLTRDELGIAAAEEGPWPLVDEGGELVAVYVAHQGGTVKPAMVLA